MLVCMLVYYAADMQNVINTYISFGPLLPHNKVAINIKYILSTVSIATYIEGKGIKTQSLGID